MGVRTSRGDGKEWYIVDKYDEKKAGPFKDDLKADDYLVKLRNKYPNEGVEDYIVKLMEADGIANRLLYNRCQDVVG